MGPLLFIIYINDITKCLSKCTAKLHADDTAIVASGNGYIDVMLSLRIEMSNIVEWLRLNKLTLNVKKTKLLILGTLHKLSRIKYSPLMICNEVVERVDYFKYLGIFLDKNLTFNHHIDKLYKQTCSKIGLLKRVRYLTDRPTALTLYKSLVLPHLDYCDVYTTAKQESLSKLQTAQNIACRTILLADKLMPTNVLHESLNMSLLADQRNFHFGNLCHKNIFPEEMRTGLINFFKLKSDGNIRISHRMTAKDVVVPDIRLQLGRKSIGYRGPAFWNKLPKYSKDTEKFSSFVTKWKCICFPNFENHPT